MNLGNRRMPTTPPPLRKKSALRKDGTAKRTSSGGTRSKTKNTGSISTPPKSVANPNKRKDLRKEIWDRKASWRESIRRTYTNRFVQSSRVREETLLLLEENFILDLEYLRENFLASLKPLYLEVETPITRTLEPTEQARKSGAGARLLEISALKAIVDKLEESVFANFEELIRYHKEFYQNLNFFHDNIRTDFSVCLLRFVEGKDLQELMEDMFSNFIPRLELLMELIGNRTYPKSHMVISMPYLRRKRFGVAEAVVAPIGRCVEPIYFLILPIFHHNVLLTWIQNEISYYQRRDSQCSDYFEAWSIISSQKERYLPAVYTCDELMRLQDSVCFFGRYIQKIPDFVTRKNRFLRSGTCLEVGKGEKVIEREAILTYDYLLIGNIKKFKASQDSFVLPSRRFEYYLHFRTQDFRIQDIGESNDIAIVEERANNVTREIVLKCSSQKDKEEWIASFLLIPNIRERPGHASTIEHLSEAEEVITGLSKLLETKMHIPDNHVELDDEFDDILSDVTGSLDVISCIEFWRKMESEHFATYFAVSVIAKLYSLELPMNLKLSILMRKLRDGSSIPPLPLEYSSEELEVDYKKGDDILENHLHDSLVHTLYYVLLNFDIQMETAFFRRARDIFYKYSKKSYLSLKMGGYPEILEILETGSKQFQFPAEKAKKDFVDGIEILSISKVGPERFGIKRLEEINSNKLGLLSSTIIFPYMLNLVAEKKINLDMLFNVMLLYLKFPNIPEGRMLSLLELIHHLLAANKIHHRALVDFRNITLGYFVWPLPYGEFAAYILQLMREEERLAGTSQWRMLMRSLPEMFFDVANPTSRCLSVNILFDIDEPFAVPFQGLLFGGQEELPNLSELRYKFVHFYLTSGVPEEVATKMKENLRRFSCKELATLCLDIQTAVERYTVDCFLNEEEYAEIIQDLQENVYGEKLPVGTGYSAFNSKLNFDYEKDLLHHKMEFFFATCSDVMMLGVNKLNGMPQYPLSDHMKAVIFKHLGISEGIVRNIGRRGTIASLGEKPKMESNTTKRILKFAICGGDKLISATMSAYISLMLQFPLVMELAECVFYVLPLGKDDMSNRVSQFLGLYDGWYEDHVLRLVRISPRILPTPNITGYSPNVAAKWIDSDSSSMAIKNVQRKRKGTRRTSATNTVPKGSPFHQIRTAVNNYFVQTTNSLDFCVFHVETLSSIQNGGIASLTIPDSVVQKATNAGPQADSLLSLTSTIDTSLDPKQGQAGMAGMISYFRNFTFIRKLEFGFIVDKEALGGVFMKSFEPANLFLKFLKTDIVGVPVSSPTLLEGASYRRVTCYNLHPSFDPQTKKIPSHPYLLLEMEGYHSEKVELHRVLYLEVESTDQKKSFYVSVDDEVTGPFFKIRTKILYKPFSHQHLKFRIMSYFPLDFS